jgi:hypothetical protein
LLLVVLRLQFPIEGYYDVEGHSVFIPHSLVGQWVEIESGKILMPVGQKLQTEKETKMTTSQMNFPEYDSSVASNDYSVAQGTGGSGLSAGLWRPKPFKDKQTYCNRVFIPLVRPAAMRGFETYPETHYNFYVKLHGHYIEIPTGGDKKRTEFVACHTMQNKYVSESIAKSRGVKMFDDDRCPACEKASAIWDQYSERWAQLGYPDKESRQKLSKDTYREIANDPELKALKDAAMQYQHKVRFVFPVYDLEQQPLEKGVQWFFGAETVFKGLMSLANAKSRFYDLRPHPHNPNAVVGSEIQITKDTKDGVRRSTYTVQDVRQELQLSHEEVQFLLSMDNYPQLSEFYPSWEYDQFQGVIEGSVVADEQSAAPMDEVPVDAGAYTPDIPAGDMEEANNPLAPGGTFAPTPAPRAAAPAPRVSTPAPTAAPRTAAPAPARTAAPAPARTAAPAPARTAPAPTPAPASARTAAPAPARTAPTPAPAAAAPRPARRTW